MDWRERAALTRAYVQDAIDALANIDDAEAREASSVLADFLRCDGPDVLGTVNALSDYGLLSQEWLDRLITLNDLYGGDEFNEEIEELREALAKQSTS